MVHPASLQGTPARGRLTSSISSFTDDEGQRPARLSHGGPTSPIFSFDNAGPLPLTQRPMRSLLVRTPSFTHQQGSELSPSPKHRRVAHMPSSPTFTEVPETPHAYSERSRSNISEPEISTQEVRRVMERYTTQERQRMFAPASDSSFTEPESNFSDDEDNGHVSSDSGDVEVIEID